MRKKMKKKKDQKIFKSTAVDRKKINVNPVIPRGGIRL